MCHPTQSFKLCTCSYKKDAGSFWKYSKPVHNNIIAIGEIRLQMSNIENWDELEALVLKRLNEPDVFDFDVLPETGDRLELKFAGIHPAFHFSYFLGKWQPASPDDAFVESKLFRKGKLKES